MNKIQKITLYTILMGVSLNIFAGKNDAKPDPDSNEYYLNAGGMGSDAGAKFGLITAAFIAKKIGLGWASVKVTAASVAAAPGIPYVAGAAALGGAGYISYRLYCSLNPTPEERARIEKNIEKDRAAAEHARLQIDREREERDLIKARQDFRTCLSSNIRSPRRKCMPIPCMEKAAIFAMRAPQGEVEQIISSFGTYKECENH